MESPTNDFLASFDYLILIARLESIRLNESEPVGLALGTAVVHLLGRVQQHHRLEHVRQLLNQGLEPKYRKR